MSATSTPTRRRPTRSPPRRATSTRLLDACPVPPEEAATVVGVAGTVLTVAAGVLDLPAYDRDAIDQTVLPRPTYTP